jgi:hypothetical protein
MSSLTRLLRLIATACAVALVACSDADLIEYRGSAMSEATTDSAASLSILFWSHTDSSFSGFVRVGPPISGSGSAYAWHEHATLKIVTVSSAGDTLLWTSRATDDSIGGTFQTIGAPTEQAGTWRAQRVKGRAISPAALRAPTRSDWPVPALLVLPAVVLATILGMRWILRKPTPPGPPLDDDRLATIGRVSGIGGWLAFFCFGQLVTTVIAVIRAPSTIGDVVSSWALGAISPLLRPTLLLEVTFNFARIILPAVGLYLTFRRNRYTPRFWMAFTIVVGVFAAIDIAASDLIQSQLFDRLGRDVSASGEWGAALRDNLRTVVWALIWAFYWAGSLRVRATFGADGIDRLIGPASSLSAQAGAPQSPEPLAES